ncbi:timeless-domain-containing protein [Ramaria rubella]|nr:timeless-domain-containing protein [Ramaria rubella]
MAPEEELSDSQLRGGTPDIDRRSILTPAITSVITALGGLKGGKYILGDEAYGCLKDLKKFWRKDDTDDERTVARIFWKARVLQNDLVPILLETAGRGDVEDRRAIICAELITSMTWPIDMASELMELDEELDVGTDYTALLSSHLSYKAVLIQPEVLKALFGIMLPPLAKTKKERTERDTQIINILLHLFRNLAFIRDLPSNTHLSADQAEHSSLQSKLIMTLSKTHILDALVTLATNSEKDPLFTNWNTILMETFYLLFRGVKPSSLVQDQVQAPKNDLIKLLDVEAKRKRNIQRNAASRHSRFGTTISIKAGQDSMILHSQDAIKKEARDIVDGTKKRKHQKAKTLDELGTQDNLTSQALAILQGLARDFIESCFNPFLAYLLKDIKSERPKITEKDNLRLLFVTQWFLEFFLAALPTNNSGNGWDWNFLLVSEVVNREWIVWILRRMRGAVEDKPKQWTELQAGIECLTQLLLLIDGMALVSDPMLSESAEILQHQLYYNGEVLDLAIEGLQNYKEQSIAYLDSSINLAYVLLRMLERWGKKKGDVYVRRRRTRAKNRRKGKGVPEEEGVLDVADVEDEVAPDDNDVIEEQMFTFDKFEAKFANEDIARTLLVYLSRFKELSEDNIKRVVSLLHRQAVKAKAEGLFFKVSTLDLFKSILEEQKSLPRSQPYKELIQLVNYILRQFFKAAEKDSFLIVEAFFPKNRGQWKNFSSWEPDKPEKKTGKGSDEVWKYPQDVQVKKGFSWTEQLGIAIACLVDNKQGDLVDWIKEILATVIGVRRRIIEEADGRDGKKDSEDEDMDEDEKIRKEAGKLRGPSGDAVAQFEDYLIPYVSDEQADAATKNPPFKLVCRLVKFYVLDDNADELEWYVPAGILPSELQISLNVINQFLEKPLDLEGKKAAQLLSKKARRRARRRAPSSEPESEADDNEDRPKRKARKKKEEVQYKSAQFIEDSDAELGDDEEFFKKEAALRDRAALAAADGRNATMKATGTKKRKKNKEGEGREKKKWKGTLATAAPSASAPHDPDNTSDSDEPAEALQSERRSSTTPATTPEESAIVQQARPRPKPIFGEGDSQGDSLDRIHPAKDSSDEDNGPHVIEEIVAKPKPRPKPTFRSSEVVEKPQEDGSDGEVVNRVRRRASKVVVISDDEE